MYPKLSMLKFSAQNSDPENLLDFVIVLQNDKVKVRFKSILRMYIYKTQKIKENFPIKLNIISK